MCVTDDFRPGDSFSDSSEELLLKAKGRARKYMNFLLGKVRGQAQKLTANNK